MYNFQTPTYILGMARRKRVIAETDISGVAAQIRAIRKRKGVSQAELAQQLGVTQRVISYYENAKTNLSVEIISKIAKALGVTQKKLFEYEDKPVEETPLSTSMQKKLNLVAKLPYADQQFVLKTISMLVTKNGIG